MEVNEESTKANCFMIFTSLGIIVFLHPIIKLLDVVSIIALQLLRLSYCVFCAAILISARLFPHEKAYFPMTFTLLGIIID